MRQKRVKAEEQANERRGREEGRTGAALAVRLRYPSMTSSVVIRASLAGVRASDG